MKKTSIFLVNGIIIILLTILLSITEIEYKEKLFWYCILVIFTMLISSILMFFTDSIIDIEDNKIYFSDIGGFIEIDKIYTILTEDEAKLIEHTMQYNFLIKTENGKYILKVEDYEKVYKILKYVEYRNNIEKL